MNTNQSFEYTGSSQYDINNVILSNASIALFDTLTGVGGVDFMPSNGSVVTVKSGDPSGAFNGLVPTLNNKLYYLVSDQLYDQSDTDIMITDRTEIPVIFNDGIFEGTFTFVNPNDYEYLYLFWDYSDNIGLGTVSFLGETSDRSILFPLGINIGITGIKYNAIDYPTRFQIMWGDVIVADSQYVGLNTLSNYDALINNGVDPSNIALQAPYDGLVNNGAGSLLFKKFAAGTGFDDATIIVSSPVSASSVWIISKIDTYLNSFWIDITDGTDSDVCTQCPLDVYYHNGLGLRPVSGDTVYPVSNGLKIFEGNDAYHMIDTSICTIPTPVDKTYCIINDLGIVTYISECNCPDFAVPFIYQEDIYFNINENVSIPISATNFPTSWTVDTPCLNYLLTGGTDSTLFEYTDCDGNLKNITVSQGIDMPICTLSFPTVVRGSGLVSDNGTCNSTVFPSGITFDSGVLSGIVNEATNFSMDLVAENCFGQSETRTIGVYIGQSSDYNPFLIDIEQFKKTSADCCTITPSFTLSYFSGSGLVPTK